MKTKPAMKAPIQRESSTSDAMRVTTSQPRRLESTTLFGARDEVLIAHQGETYRLRRTRQGKLILTK